MSVDTRGQVADRVSHAERGPERALRRAFFLGLADAVLGSAPEDAPMPMRDKRRVAAVLEEEVKRLDDQVRAEAAAASLEVTR